MLSSRALQNLTTSLTTSDHIMSIYEKIASNERYLKCLAKELPNSSEAYDEEAFLVRFEQNLENGRKSTANLFTSIAE